VLQVTGLSAGYGNIQVLKEVGLHVKEGQIVALIGANGAGKTTTLRAICGQITPWAGRVLFQGEPVEGLPSYQLARRGLVHVPEGRAILTRMTVRENLEMGAFSRRDREVAADMEQVLLRFPRLKERLRQSAGTLSGGEQQMLAIGRALMARPKVLLLDEPSMGLAPLIVADIFRLLQEINEEGVTMLLVEQNARQALRIAHYAYVIETGRITLEGPAAELMNNEQVAAAYLGGSSQARR